MGLLISLTGGCTSAPTEPPRILFIGDSITQGVYDGRLIDEEGGYPGRLQQRLGDRAIILNRGIGGLSTRQWLASVGESEAAPFWELLRKLYPAANLPEEPPPGSPSLAEAVLSTARPDVTIIGLGANDMKLVPLNHDPPVRSQAFADRFLERLHEIHALAQRHSDTVLVSTILPSFRDPDDVRRRLNRRIHDEFPNVISLGESFENQAWLTLLSDSVHPSPAGYDRLAELVQMDLEGRGLLPPPSEPDPSQSRIEGRRHAPASAAPSAPAPSTATSPS